jgi:2'-5' RNA ligase
MEKVRSFIAIELPAELRQGLAQLQVRLKVDKPRVKWVDPNSIHLTLKFLGSVDPTMIGAIAQAMTESAQSISPFQLEVQPGLGAFPNLKRVQVVWVGLGGELEKLGQLQGLLEDSLSRLGFAPETRAFKPHLTLARLGNEASPEERQRFGELIAATKFELSCSIRVDALSLMKSQLTREGAIYTKLSSADLKKDI